jgi:hypothetical protein
VAPVIWSIPPTGQHVEHVEGSVVGVIADWEPRERERERERARERERERERGDE